MKNKYKKVSFINKVDKFEKKHNILFLLHKTLPVMIVCSCLLLGSVMFISYSSKNTANFELPYTGSETEKYFSWNKPEHYTMISLPYSLSIYSSSVESEDKLTFYAKKNTGNPFEIASATEGEQVQEYTANWNEADEGRYELWAELIKPNGISAQSEKIIVYVK